MAQDAGAPQFTLTGTGGVVGIMLPAFDTGAMGEAASGGLIGGMLGGNITTGVGQIGDYDGLLSLNVFGIYGMGMTSSSTDTYSGPGTVIISGLSAPDAGSITLDPGGATDVDITGANGASGTIVAGGSVINDAGVSPDLPGFILGAYTDDNAGAEASYGAIADTSGGIFIASGDFSGLAIETSVSRSVFYGGADLTLGLVGGDSGAASFVGYFGPSVKLLNDTTTTRVTVDIPEVAPTGGVVMPEFTMSHEDLLQSLYLGGVIGGSVAIVGEPGIVYSLGIEGGAYAVGASWRGQDTYSTCCGLDPVDPSPDLSVVADPLTHDYGTAIAFSAKGSAAVTHAIGGNKALTIGGSAEYLSHVARVDHSDLVSVGGSDDWVAADGSPATSTFSWGHMLNVAITASLTGTF